MDIKVDITEHEESFIVDVIMEDMLLQERKIEKSVLLAKKGYINKKELSDSYYEDIINGIDEQIDDIERRLDVQVRYSQPQVKRTFKKIQTFINK